MKMSQKNMMMDTQSDSRFYHGDCLCEKEVRTSLIAVQCEDCINNDESRYYNNYRDYKCDCKNIRIKHMECFKCGELRDNIDNLNEELNKINYTMMCEIRMYMDCEQRMERIKEISIELRNLNRRLLENLIRKK